MNRTEYIGKLNALYVGDKNCLEELITAYDEKDKEIEKLNNIINEVSKELKEFNESYLEDEGDTGVYRYLNKLIEKLNEGE